MDRCNKCHLKELRDRRGRTSRQGQTERCFSVDSWRSSAASRRRLGRRKIDLSTLTPPLYQLPHRRSLNFARACARKCETTQVFGKNLAARSFHEVLIPERLLMYFVSWLSRTSPIENLVENVASNSYVSLICPQLTAIRAFR